jgi:hypothetical protein
MNKHELKSLLENIYTALTEESVSPDPPMELGLRFDPHDPYDQEPPTVLPPKPTPQWHWEWDGTNLRYWLLPYTPSSA